MRKMNSMRECVKIPFLSVPNARKRTKGSVTEYSHYNMKLGQDPYIDRRKRSWKLVQNPIIFSTFFGENIKFDFLTSGKISKTGSRLSRCDDPVRISIWLTQTELRIFS